MVFSLFLRDFVEEFSTYIATASYEKGLGPPKTLLSSLLRDVVVL